MQQFSVPEYGKNEIEKDIEIKKAHNFRTVGNIKNIDGRTLKEGKFYRSGHLHKLKKKSFDELEKLGIKEIIDLRNSKEIAQKPDNLPGDIVYKNYSAFKDEGDQLDQAKKLVLKGKVDGSDADKRMLEFYRNYVTENPEIIKKVITEILDSDQTVLYHCTAGKDRTGIITALILSILKFDKETIYNDYLLSNNYREKLVDKRLNLANNLHFLYPKMDVKVLEKLSWVETGYLDAAFNEINKEYGSIDNYIQKVLGISENKRQEYIQKFTY
ncbi:MAG: protein-tyrosine-phosphatase [Chryseobacterium sp.]|uniref:tyrosine-protein phosphatase n=1 Tax=Chryseobacterium sp. TaxID=1871047 RepID=UPI000DB4EE20|nr:tyrosine-protein phosphatase [Chryseobacterium sp.]MPS65151.1 tyrosine-protein phosphatase [Chryseobacterium sp.]PZU18505.1 MAG: protein-tyrosine-phosphatase [Chryseobacterium sp.]